MNEIIVGSYWIVMTVMFLLSFTDYVDDTEYFAVLFGLLIGLIISTFVLYFILN